MPKVDVIIPTYNRAEFLRSAIASVLNQTYRNFDIIVVDDASQDHSAEVVRSFEDTRIRYMRHELNKGEAAARNTGVMSSGADLVTFLDDDDEWLPDKLRKQVALLEKSDEVVGVVYVGYMAIDRTTGKIVERKVPEKEGDIHYSMTIENVIGGPSNVLLKRACFEKVGLFDEKIHYGLDYDMWIRVSKEFHFQYIGDALVKYFHHEMQVSRNLEIVANGWEALLTKWHHFFAQNRKAYGRHYINLGQLHSDRKDLKRASKAFLRGTKIYPYEFRNYIKMAKGLGFCLLGEDNYWRAKRIKDKMVGHHVPTNI
jgi:glycosyltransferase involved in cell wall biosynthesis